MTKNLYLWWYIFGDHDLSRLDGCEIYTEDDIIKFKNIKAHLVIDGKIAVKSEDVHFEKICTEEELLSNPLAYRIVEESRSCVMIYFDDTYERNALSEATTQVED